MPEREQEAVQQEDVGTPAPAVATATTGLPPAGHLRPNLSPAMVTRLQSGAGNAAVSALIGDRRPRGSPRTPHRVAEDDDLMAALVAREPAATEERPEAAPAPSDATGALDA